MKTLSRDKIEGLLENSGWDRKDYSFICPQQANLVVYTIPKRLVIDTGIVGISFPFDEIFSLRFSDFGLRINGGIIGAIDN